METLTGGVEAALTTKEAFLEDPMWDWSGLGPKICLALSTEELRDDDTSACVAMFSFFFFFTNHKHKLVF